MAAASASPPDAIAAGPDTVPRVGRYARAMTDRLLLEAQRIERAIGRVRWGAAALALGLGPLFPNLSLVGVYCLGAGIVLYNLAAIFASRRARSLAAHDVVVRAAFAGDIAALAAAMLLFSADPLWTTYTLVPLVITTGAFRFGTAGTAAATVVLGGAYVAVSVFRSAAFGVQLEPERVLFALSVFVLTALLVDRVTRDAGQLRTERERLIAGLERRIAEDAALAVAMRVVATVDAPDEVIPRVLQATRVAIGFDRATVFVADQERGEYRVLYRFAEGDDVLPPRAPLGRGLVAAALAADHPILVHNILEEPRYEPRPGEPARSVILVPLRVRGRPIAVFTLSRGLPAAFTEEDLRLSSAVAALIAQTLENQRLFAEASEAQALRETDRLKNEFLAAVSHELRTPLTVVLGALELLGKQGGAVSDAGRRLVAQAERHAQRLTRSVSELLEIAQLQDAKVQLEREFVECDALLVDVASAHEPLAETRSQRLVVEGEPVPRAYVDRNRLQQVLGNLVSNAVRYSPEGATIGLAVCLRDKELVFSVTDQGPGIPPEERERVFDKFVRLRRDRNVPGGTGLGLAIAKSLVELHGGRIWVEDGPRGARFLFAIPYDAAPLEAKAVG